MWLFFLILFISLPYSLSSHFFMTDRLQNPLLFDLERAAYFDRKMYERFPVTFNHVLSSGYFVTPSARMSLPSDLSIGYADAFPYQNWNARLQIFRWMELSVNYRLFKNCPDVHLSPQGFGDYLERGANIKMALMTPEDTLYDMPGIAFGIEDFMGSKKFTNYFAVLTQVWAKLGLETSVGFGFGRFSKGPSKGFFGGINYFPCWEKEDSLFQNLGFSCEFDPIDYKNPLREPHPLGRETRFPINFGAKYKYKSSLDLSLGTLRGCALSFSGSLTYNFGAPEGFIPKIKDPPLYCQSDLSAVYFPQEAFLKALAGFLKIQGFQLTSGWIEERTLYISVMNLCYRKEFCVRERIQCLLSQILPDDFDATIVVLESYGMPCQQYVYLREWLKLYASSLMGLPELSILTPRQNVTHLPCTVPDFYQPLDLWRCQISPRFETFFGSAKGKFKYDLGVKALCEGFLPYRIFYETQISYTLVSTTNDVADFDFFSPSQLPNVLTDYVNYRQRRFFSTDRAYLQKNWNMGSGFFSKVALGYFQVNYAGIEGECLWYPAHACFAFGLEGALLKKRRYTGLGFQSQLRKMNGFTPTFIPYTFLSQYFLNFHFDIPEFYLAGKISAGSFLAWDKGFRFELTRYFDSGLRISGWMTVTNAQDIIHGENYFNRGICIELPLDLIMRRSSKRIWNYGLAAWLRDAGASIPTGKSLFEIVNLERRP